jgi:hypothetical protein
LFTILWRTGTGRAMKTIETPPTMIMRVPNDLPQPNCQNDPFSGQMAQLFTIMAIMVQLFTTMAKNGAVIHYNGKNGEVHRQAGPGPVCVWYRFLDGIPNRIRRPKPLPTKLHDETQCPSRCAPAYLREKKTLLLYT